MITNLMKEMKFPSWALRLSTNRGNVFDIVKLDIAFAATTISFLFFIPTYF